MKIDIKQFFFPILLVIISILSHVVWLNPNSLLTNGDIWFLFREGMLTANWGTWTSVLSLGEPNVSYNLFLLTLVWQIISHVGLSYQVANQLVYFLPIIFITPITTFIYLKYITNRSIASFVGTLVYMFTTIFLMMQNGGLLLASAYMLLPSIFYFLEKYLRSKKQFYGLLFVLFLSLSIFYELRVTYLTIFVIFFYVLYFYISIYKRHFIKHLVNMLVSSIFLFILLLLLNAYIYIPLLFSSIQQSASGVLSRGLFGVNFFTLKEPFVLMHPFWSGKVPTEFVPQPIPFYFWLYPLYAFTSLFFVHKEKRIGFFACIALFTVFIGKSASDPLGWVYTWLYFNFPGFGFFREPSKFWPMISFSYTVLIAFTLSYILKKIDTRFKLKALLYYLFILCPIIIVSILVGKPAFTSELGPLFKSLRVTSEHYYLKDYLHKQEDFFRTYYIPGRYRMGFWSEIHPMIGLNEIPEYFRSLDPYLLSLLSVKYLIMPPDITNDVYRHWGNKLVYKESLEEAQGFEKLNDSRFGTFIVYQALEAPKPRFFAAEDLTYVIGDQSNITKLLKLTTSKKTNFYFESAEYTGPDAEIKELQRKEKKINLQNSSELFVLANCIRCQDRNYRDTLVYPFIRFLPNSPLYTFITNRELSRTEELKGDIRTRLKLEVFYASKRMIELQEIYDLKLPEMYATLSLQLHKKILSNIHSDLKLIDMNTLDNESLLYLDDYLSIQLDIARTYLTNNMLNSENIALLTNNYKDLLVLSSILKSKLWVGNQTEGKYLLSVPKDGYYDLLIEKNSQELLPQLELDGINNKLMDSKYEGWLSGGNVFLSKGSHKITLRNHNQILDRELIKLEIPANDQHKEFSIPINGIKENTEYLITFVYKTSPDVRIRYYLERNTDFKQNGGMKRTHDRFFQSDSKWHEVSDDRFITRFGEKQVNIRIIVDKDSKDLSNIEISNLKIIKNTDTVVALKQSLDSNLTSAGSPPTIYHQWINPTKYRLHITGANKPFYLVFNETYHSSWNVYYKDEDKIDKSLIIRNETNNLELKPLNRLDIFTFLSMFRKQSIRAPIHFSINSYANSWYIDKTGNYSIDIEFEPQKTFSLSLLISSLTLVIIILSLFFLYFKAKKS